MDVRPGYKQTEVGMIPEDWEIKRLEEIASVSSGGTPSRHNQAYWGGDIPWVTTTQIDSNLIVEANEFITVVGLQNSATKVYVAGTLLMAMYGQGNTRGKVAILGIDAAINQACAAIKLDKSVSHGYVCSNLAARYEEIRGLSNTGNQENLNSQIIKNILVPLPPLPEQCAIAEALSDADALIESLEQLIAKKQQVKQGAMQELLTGKRRLPGFRGAWEQKRLRDICGHITTGKLDANAMVENGEYPFFTCARERYFIDKYAFDADALLVSGNGANVGYIHHYHGKFNAYQRTYVLTDFSVEILYMKLFMEKNLQQRIRTEVNAGNTSYIKMDTLTDMSVEIPSTREEQIAIAEVLSNMDEEIAALEDKLAKARQIKQGMMQELLTGRVRLV